MGTEATANAGSEQSLTEQGTPDGTQSLNEQAEERSIEGLSRRVEKQNKVIAALTEQVKASQDKEPDATAKELAEAKADLAKSKLLLKYKDVADKLEPIIKKGLSPEFIDDDFVAILRSGAETEEESAPAHNPVRGRLTPEQEATRVLKGLDTLF